jgi:hypothetical protein
MTPFLRLSIACSFLLASCGGSSATSSPATGELVTVHSEEQAGGETEDNAPLPPIDANIPADSPFVVQMDFAQLLAAPSGQLISSIVPKIVELSTKLDTTRPIEPWLMQTTVNVCRNIGRTRQRRWKTFPAFTGDESSAVCQKPNPHEGLAEEQGRLLLWKALDTLSEKERLAVILRDIPPYVMCNGNPCEPHGVNSEGLKRRGFDPDTINLLRRAYKLIYRDGKTVAEAVAAIDELIAEAPASAAAIALLRDFVRDSPRGIIR